jgi:hypothetical protein
MSIVAVEPDWLIERVARRVVELLDERVEVAHGRRGQCEQAAGAR